MQVQLQLCIFGTGTVPKMQRPVLHNEDIISENVIVALELLLPK